MVIKISVGERPRLQGEGSKLLIGYVSRVSIKVAWHLNEAGAPEGGVPWLLRPVRKSVRTTEASGELQIDDGIVW